MIIKNILTFSIASAFALAASATHADDDIEGVEMNSRMALADCMIEAAVSAIAAIETSAGSCVTGEWNLDVSVPEPYLNELPIQGTLVVYNAEEGFTFNGKLTAKGVVSEEAQDVLCEVQTVGDDNAATGKQFTYASGQNNIYPAAQTDADDPYLSISSFESRGNITFEDSQQANLAEVDHLEFFEGEEGTILADGFVNILLRMGNRIQVLSTWEVEEEDDAPLWIQKTDKFKAEFITDQLGVAECEIEIEADIAVDDFELTMNGSVEVEAEDE